jgi:hypothetical protein
MTIWYLLKVGNNCYRCRTCNETDKTIYQHREVMELALGRKLLRSEHIDHINGDGLNNKLNNLRICARQENARNITKRATASSRYKGVTFYKRDGNWQAKTMVNYKTIHLGYFNIEEEAAKAYDLFAIQNFGEFAKLNFPKEL